MDINEPIKYTWTLGWDSNRMSSPRPTVNRLLKAIIEKNVPEMESLFAKGATLEGIDEATFARGVWHILDNYSVVKCMVEHGFTGLYGNYKFAYLRLCGPDSYFWQPYARAWYLGAYDVMDLLAQNGFGDMFFCINGEGYHGDKIAFKKNDIRAIKILIENGMPRKKFNSLMREYPDSKVTRYLEENPLIERKTIALDPEKYSKIPKPQLEQPGFFNKKKVQQRNALLMADYEDRIRVQKEFIEEIGQHKYQNIIKQNKEIAEGVGRFLDDLFEEYKIKKGL